MPSTQVRTDVFPAILQLVTPDGTESRYDNCRVILTLDSAYVFTDGQPTPTRVFEDRLTSYTPPVPQVRARTVAQRMDRTANFETEDGYTATFMRGSGCGCGSRLKTAQLSVLFPEDNKPAATVGSVKDETTYTINDSTNSAE